MKNIPIRSIHAPVEEPAFSESFSIRDIRELLAGKDMVQELHRHDFFFILVLKKGRGRHEIDLIPHMILDHSIFFLRPGQVHQLTLKAGSTGYLVQFKTDFYYPDNKAAHQLLRRTGTRNLCQPGADGFKKLLPLLTCIFREYNGKQEGYKEVIKANLGIFFIELIRHRQHSKSSATSVTPYMQERLEELSELLETHIAGHKQVSWYADRLNLSPYQLNAITKTTLGKTCSELINEQIILEAKRALLATSGQVKEIAWQLGYEDASYFIRFFKKHTGYSPEGFRHNFR
ncbi:MAG: helix-turn-helix domain-containing protein [Chitinophagaceae bacterium]|nr:helix-turn-helix domain-containing protein [Chitinophagaceae bacterium]